MRDANGMPIIWKPIGGGTYNKTYKSETPFTWMKNDKPYHQIWIMKTRKCVDPLNHAKRAVALWNEINPDHPAVLLSEERSWMAPFIPGKQASDMLVQKALIDIYKKTRRIIWDGCGEGNMLEHDGQAFCVDVDQAFSRHSPTSLEAIKNIGIEEFNKYWQSYVHPKNKQRRPKSVATILTLIYLEKYLDDEEIQAKYLTVKSIDHLSKLREQKLPISKNDLTFAATLNTQGFEKHLTDKLIQTRHMTTHLTHSHRLFKPEPKTAPKEAENSWVPSFLKLW